MAVVPICFLRRERDYGTGTLRGREVSDPARRPWRCSMLLCGN